MEGRLAKVKTQKNIIAFGELIRDGDIVDLTKYAFLSGLSYSEIIKKIEDKGAKVEIVEVKTKNEIEAEKMVEVAKKIKKIAKKMEP